MFRPERLWHSWNRLFEIWRRTLLRREKRPGRCHDRRKDSHEDRAFHKCLLENGRTTRRICHAVRIMPSPARTFTPRFTAPVKDVSQVFAITDVRV